MRLNHPETASAELQALADRLLSGDTFYKPGAIDLMIIIGTSCVIDSHTV